MFNTVIFTRSNANLSDLLIGIHHTHNIRIKKKKKSIVTYDIIF